MSKISLLEQLTRSELAELAQEHKNKSNILTALGISRHDGRAHKKLSLRLKEHEIELTKPRTYKNYSKSDIEKAVKTSICYADVLRKIGLQPAAGNFKNLKQIIEYEGFDVSHFDSVKAAKTNQQTKWSYEQIFCKESNYPRHRLYTAVIKYGVIEYQCNECGNTGSWNNKPLTLDVDHINGIRNDNRIENLRYLCPNCHRQTPTWGNRYKTGV